MGIRDILDKLRGKNAQFKAMEDEARMQERIIEKRKSANERELERFHEEARQRRIKEELDEWRNMKKEEDRYGHQILKTKNMFNNGGKSEMLKEKKLFSDKSNLNTHGGLFWK